MDRRKNLWVVLVVMVLLFPLGKLIEHYSQMPGTPALQQGQRMIFQMAGASNLEQVEFRKNYPMGRPSDFLEMISDSDHVLWPRDSADGDLVPSTQSNRIPMPPGVVFSLRERTVPTSDELVVDADEEGHTLLVRGYVGGETSPSFEYVWDFPTKAGRVTLR